MSASAPQENEALSASQPVDAETFYKAGRRMRQAGHFRAASDFFERAVGYEAHRYTAWVEWIDTLVRAISRYRAQVQGVPAESDEAMR